VRVSRFGGPLQGSRRPGSSPGRLFLLHFGEQGAAAYTGRMKARIVSPSRLPWSGFLYVTRVAHMGDLGSVTCSATIKMVATSILIVAGHVTPP
jgi:hypothetical protein